MCSARSAARASTARISSPRRSRAARSAVVARPEAKVEGAAHLAADEPRKLFAELAARFFAPYPDTIVAVTGTNGKTSTVEMTRQLWRMAGHRSASIGTLGVTTADDQVKTGLTTPDIVTFLQQHGGHASGWGSAMSPMRPRRHGLDQYRAEGVPVQAAAFTNLQPRPPRLSSRHGRLFRGQDAAVRRGRRRRRNGGGVDRRCQVGRGDRRVRSARAASCSRSGRARRRSSWSSRAVDPARPAAGASPCGQGA